MLEQGAAPQPSTPKSAEGGNDKVIPALQYPMSTTSNPSTFQPGQWMAWQALAAPSSQALCQIISGREPLDPGWFSSTQLQWLSWFWCQPGQGQLKPIRSSQLHHPVSADEKSSLSLAPP